MLLRFGVENHRSIKDRQELSFIASRISDEPSHRFNVASLGEDALPVIGVYGANASGKSNVLDALQFFRSQVLDSQVRRRPGEPMGRAPFKLSAASCESPSRFDVDFLLDGIRYHYGFAIDEEKVLEERLYSWPKGRKQLWFQRQHREGNLFHFGASLKGHNQTIAALTRDNSLFLSATAQHNHGQLTHIYQWINEGLDSTITPSRHLFSPRDGELRELQDPAQRPHVIALLQKADLGIIDVQLRKHASLKDLFNKTGESDIKYSLRPYLGHRSEEGELIYFSLSEESLGTRSYLAILLPALRALDRGGLLVIDELDTSLHTLLAQAIIGLFTSPETNPKGAQILFTTHDTNVLSCLRRDEIWFTEKDRGGATTLYPLTDIQTRQRDDIEKGYLQGRYGAIPVLGDFAKALDRGEE